MTPIIRKHPRLALILAMMLWGASFPAMKHAMGEMSSFGVVWIRMGISLLLLKETLTAPQWLACGIVLLGVIIGQMGVRDNPTPIKGTCPAA